MFDNKFFNWRDDYGLSLAMIADTTRNQFYDTIFSETVQGKHCIEIGFGTGFLSFLALKYDPKHITAYEIDKERYELGKYLIDKLGAQDKITLINQRFSLNDIRDTHDLIFHEIVDQDLWGEGLYCNFTERLPLVPSKYYCDFYACPLTQEQVDAFLDTAAIETNREQQWKDFYNSVKGADWPICGSYKDFDQLPELVKDECINMFGFQRYDLPPRIDYKPGVEFENSYPEEIERLINDFLQTTRSINTIQIIKNSYGSLFGKPEYDAAIENGVKFYSYEFDHNAKTLTTDYMGKRTVEPMDLTKMNIDILVDKSILNDGATLLIPRYSIGHGEHRLILNPNKLSRTHWPIPNQPAIITNPTGDITIRQYLNTGLVRYKEN